MGDVPVWKSSGTLADGREIVYYDESPGLGRADVPDQRLLDAAPRSPSQLRFDPFTGEQVIVAAQRQHRTHLPPADQCPLCPSRPGSLTEIPAGDYDVVVFENRFPSLAGAGGLRAAAGQYPAAAGRCEVVCFTADHDASFAALPPRRVRTVLEAWTDRTATLHTLPEVEQVYCFENRGRDIGVTLSHPHGQIYAFPFVTPRTAQMIQQARTHAAAGRGNLFDAVLANETTAATRLVSRNDHWTAFVPAAARWPFEVRIFPTRRVPSLAGLAEPARAAFSTVYLDVLRRLDAVFAVPVPYIAAWHQAPASDDFASAEFGLHLQVFTIRRAPDKLKYLAGVESGMGAWINDIVPEEAARRLREAV